MNLPKDWHIDELKDKKPAPHSSYQSKSKLIHALVRILAGKDSFTITVPNWKKFIVYKGERSNAQ